MTKAKFGRQRPSQLRKEPEPPCPLPTPCLPPSHGRSFVLVSVCTSLTPGPLRLTHLYPDNHQYATWNRTRQLSQPRYLARVDTRASRVAAEMAQQQPVVIDMGNVTPTLAPQPKDKKAADTLFGPNIGVLSTGPKWTERQEKSPDPLTAEVVKSWIAKSKEVSGYAPIRSLWLVTTLAENLVPRSHCARHSRIYRDATYSDVGT